MKRSFNTPEEMLYDLGNRKTKEGEEISWSMIADGINDEFGTDYSDSWCRKRYKAMSERTNGYVAPLPMDTELNTRMKITLLEMEKQRMRVNAEHKAYRGTLRKEMTWDAFLEDLRDAIVTAEPVASKYKPKRNAGQQERAVYALLGDVHYGLAFSHFYGEFNTDIAKERVMRYAESVIRIGQEAQADTCYVTLLGDMISGISHKTIRLENTETMAGQIVGVSELVAAFLLRLSESFASVVVNAVDGNHSRIDPDPENALRKERIDHLIVWYSKAKLANIENVEFRDNQYDPTMADFEIFNKLYLAVHGDFDTMTTDSVNRIQGMIGRKIDYFLTGHMHVPEMRMENTTFIRNGAIVTGGDDYTSKKRLFGPAAQICLVVSPKGVESMHTVRLSEEECNGSD